MNTFTSHRRFAYSRETVRLFKHWAKLNRLKLCEASGPALLYEDRFRRYGVFPAKFMLLVEREEMLTVSSWIEVPPLLCLLGIPERLDIGGNGLIAFLLMGRAKLMVNQLYYRLGLPFIPR